MAVMLERDICDLMKKQGYYRTPELNDRLYLHFKGYRKIENLDAFVAVRTVYLENNAIEVIEGLEKLRKLNTLYLQNNIISSIGHHLSVFRHLETLNVSNNALESLDGVESLCFLRKLNVSCNAIKSLAPLEKYAERFVEWVEDVDACSSSSDSDTEDDDETGSEQKSGSEESDTVSNSNASAGSSDEEPGDSCDKASSCSGSGDASSPAPKSRREPRRGQQLDCLDVSHNELADEAEVMRIVPMLVNMKTLYLHQNAFMKHVRNYRKTVVAACRELKFLDDYPVFDDERRMCEKFAVDGLAGEKQEKKKIQQEREDRREQQRQFFDDFMAKARERRASEAAEVGAANAADASTAASKKQPPTPYFQLNKDQEEEKPTAEEARHMRHARSELDTLVRANPHYHPLQRSGVTSRPHHVDPLASCADVSADHGERHATKNEGAENRVLPSEQGADSKRPTTEAIDASTEAAVHRYCQSFLETVKIDVDNTTKAASPGVGTGGTGEASTGKSASKSATSAHRDPMQSGPAGGNDGCGTTSDGDSDTGIDSLVRALRSERATKGAPSRSSKQKQLSKAWHLAQTVPVAPENNNKK